MNSTLNLIQSFRERSGMPLQDMASIMGVSTGHLSQIENAKVTLNAKTIMKYQIILDIPFEEMMDNKYASVISVCLRNALALKDRLMKELSKPQKYDRIARVDGIIDHLLELDKLYGK